MTREDFRLRARFRFALREAGVADGAVLLVAVSGGADSVALLRLCLAEAPARGWRVHVGHVDHALRPESGEDARWVRRLAAGLGLPCHRLRVAPHRWTALRGRSVEEEARRLRRRGLRRIARECGANWILLGHTRDDQAETVLLRLLRGSGLRGLSGMSPCRPPWLRPLLEVGREELRGYLRRGGWAHREDASNADLRFPRNRVRLHLLPLLRREYQPGIDAVLARTAHSLAEAGRHLRRAGREAWAEVAREEEGGLRLDRSRLRSYHPAVAEEVLRRAYTLVLGTSRDLRQAHLYTLFRLARSRRGGTWSLPGGVQACLDRREIRLSHPRDDGKQEGTGSAGG